MEFSMYVLYEGTTISGKGVIEDYYKYKGYSNGYMQFEPSLPLTPQGFLNGLKSDNMYDYRNYNLASTNQHSPEEIIEYVKGLL